MSDKSKKEPEVYTNEVAKGNNRLISCVYGKYTQVSAQFHIFKQVHVHV